MENKSRTNLSAKLHKIIKEDGKAYTKDDLKDILDSIPYSIWLKDTEGKYIFINQKFIDELEEDCVSGQPKIHKCTDLQDDIVKGFWSSDNENYIKKTDKYIIQSRNSFQGEEWLDINGVRRWYESYRTNIVDQSGKVKYIAGIAREITTEKNINDKIASGHMMLSELNNIFNDDENDIEIILCNVISDIEKSLKPKSIHICYFDRENEVVIPIMKDKLPSKIGETRRSVGMDYETFKESCLLGGNKSIIDLKYEEHLVSKFGANNIKLLKENGIRYLGIYNIEYKSEILGVLTMGFNESETIMYSQDNFIKSICKQIGMLINNYNLKNALKKEFAKRTILEKELEEFLDTAVDLMAIVDKEGKFIKVNESWNSILGWDRDELLSIKFLDVIHSEDREKSTLHSKKVKRNICKRGFHNRCLCSDGSFKWIEWSAKYNVEQEIYIATGKDITDYKAQQAERKIYEEALQLESIKNEFFANISHEFKTPLNIILATMQLVNSHIKANKIKSEDGIDLNRYIRSIKQNSYRLLRLVNNLIDMTRIDTGYYEVSLENNNIVSVVEDIILSVADYVENRGIELIFDTEIEDLIIACDADKIERIILNLLSNAIKHLDYNGKINVLLQIVSDKVQIRVNDNGCGIEKHKLSSIFERFIQVDEILIRRNEGSGIGLSLVKSLVEMHNGVIWAESEVGKGSEFIFELPIVTVREEGSEGRSRKNEVSDIRVKIEKCHIEFSDIYN